MNNLLIPLSLVPLGKKSIVKIIENDGFTRRRLYDLGLIPNTLIVPIQKSPSQEPIAYFFRGALIALRSDITSLIFVELVEG